MLESICKVKDIDLVWHKGQRLARALHCTNKTCKIMLVLAHMNAGSEWDPTWVHSGDEVIAQISFYKDSTGLVKHKRSDICMIALVS